MQPAGGAAAILDVLKPPGVPTSRIGDDGSLAPNGWLSHAVGESQTYPDAKSSDIHGKAADENSALSYGQRTGSACGLDREPGGVRPTDPVDNSPHVRGLRARRKTVLRSRGCVLTDQSAAVTMPTAEAPEPAVEA